MGWFKRNKKEEPIIEEPIIKNEIIVSQPKPKKKTSKPKISNKKLEKTLSDFQSLIEETSRKFSSQLDTATKHYKYLGAAIEHLEKQYKGLYEIIRQNQIGIQNVYDKIDIIIHVPEYKKRINQTLTFMANHTWLIDPDHKDWLIDQIARQLLKDDYDMWSEKNHCRPSWKTGKKPPSQIENSIEFKQDFKKDSKLIEDSKW